MSEKRYLVGFLVINLMVINGVMLAMMNLRYPLVGHDFSLTVPGMLDTALHFRLNGLSIQWFTPTFAGGMPAFPNPNNGQFSLLALLAIFLPPWDAVLLSTVTYTAAGFLASWYFFQYVLGYRWTASILGAVFFSANGFFISRAAPGQIGYVTFCLLPLFLVIILNAALRTGIAATALALLFTMFIHFAGYFVLIMLGLSILIVLPLIYMSKPELFQWKKICTILLIGGGLGLVISASKLAAVYSFMRYFPRLMADNYVTSAASGFLGIVLELMGTMSLMPIYLMAGSNPDLFPSLTRSATGTHYGLWELDMAMTPVVFFLLLIGLLNLWHNYGKAPGITKDNKQRVALLLFIFFAWVGVEFTLAKGFVYPLLRDLPILSSLRANVRFAAVFIFPLVFIAARVYANLEKEWDGAKAIRTFMLVNALTVLPLSTYFMFNSDMYDMIYDIRTGIQLYEEMRNNVSFEVTDIGTPKGYNTGALVERVSNLNVYEPIFGFKLENFHPQVKVGSIWDVSDGRYNMTDPTGFVYPIQNQNKAFDRFRVEDRETLELFAKHLQPAWKLPAYQHALNWISCLALLGTSLYLVTQVVLQKRVDPKP